MQTPSFHEAIYRPLRRTVAEVSYELAAPEAKNNATADLPADNLFSRPEQILNNITDISHKIATFEPNYWKLDGSFSLPVYPAISEYEVGFWSAVMSDGDGKFEDDIIIQIQFTVSQDIPVVGIAFDRPSNNFARKIEVTFYGQTGVIYSESTENNNTAYYQTTKGAEGIHRIVIIINNTNNPYRYLRISEINFGVLILFNDADIVNLSLVTSSDPAGKSFQFNSFSITIHNSGRYSLLDPDSHARYFQQRQSLEYRHGVYIDKDMINDIEWAYCGNYYLDNWEVADDVVRFTAESKLSIIADNQYNDSTLNKFNLGTIFDDILNPTGFEYVFPDNLYNSPPIQRWFGKIELRQVLAMLSELSCCMAFENNYNIVYFVDLTGESPIETTIDYNNIIGGVPKTKLDTYFNGIIIREKIIIELQPEIRFDTVDMFYDAPWRDPLEIDYPYIVDLPMMIRGDGYAEFRDWFLSKKFEVLRNRIITDVSWRQNPALSLGEHIETQIDKRHKTKMRLISHNIKYNGGLSGSSKLIGVPPF
jgi:hypothetical protein